MMKVVQLDNYNITFGDSDSALRALLAARQYSKVAVLVDEHTRECCWPLVKDVLCDALILQINAGEKYKTLDTCSSIWSQMKEMGMDRYGLLINLGGGVIGDMGGYAASCYMRGIDFVQVPTTLLSQVDASVGGKLAIDFQGIKNLIGLFRDPQQVIIDPRFLKTLPIEELRSGYAEMLKHGLIKDQGIWADLSAGLDDRDWTTDIMRSVQIKAEVVKTDPYERGLRKILNYGHTIGHAVETISMSTEQPLLHGEAIGIGMMAEAQLASDTGLLSKKEAINVINPLLGIYDDLDYSILEREDEIIQIMYSDKKNKGGHIRCALLENIGRCSYDHQISEEQIKTALRATLAHISNIVSA